MVQFQKITANKAGSAVNLKFQITQHARDINLMKQIIEYLGCGLYKLIPNGLVGDFYVLKFIDINLKIIPFFKKYPIYGVKGLDFADFCKVAELINTKQHLTPSGLLKIENIKNGMNIKRFS